jgi:hypothetical protein
MTAFCRQSIFRPKTLFLHGPIHNCINNATSCGVERPQFAGRRVSARLGGMSKHVSFPWARHSIRRFSIVEERGKEQSEPIESKIANRITVSM